MTERKDKDFVTATIRSPLAVELDPNNISGSSSSSSMNSSTTNRSASRLFSVGLSYNSRFATSIDKEPLRMLDNEQSPNLPVLSLSERQIRQCDRYSLLLLTASGLIWRRAPAPSLSVSYTVAVAHNVWNVIALLLVILPVAYTFTLRVKDIYDIIIVTTVVGQWLGLIVGTYYNIQRQRQSQKPSQMTHSPSLSIYSKQANKQTRSAITDPEHGQRSNNNNEGKDEDDKEGVDEEKEKLTHRSRETAFLITRTLTAILLLSVPPYLPALINGITRYDLLLLFFQYMAFPIVSNLYALVFDVSTCVDLLQQLRVKWTLLQREQLITDNNNSNNRNYLLEINKVRRQINYITREGRYSNSALMITALLNVLSVFTIAIIYQKNLTYDRFSFICFTLSKEIIVAFVGLYSIAIVNEQNKQLIQMLGNALLVEMSESEQNVSISNQNYKLCSSRQAIVECMLSLQSDPIQFPILGMVLTRKDVALRFALWAFGIILSIVSKSID